MGFGPTPTTLGSDPIKLIPGNPDGLLDLAQFYQTISDQYLTCSTQVKNISTPGWRGATAQAAEHSQYLLMYELRKASDAYGDAASALADYGWVLSAAQHTAQRAIDAWDVATAAAAHFANTGPVPGLSKTHGLTKGQSDALGLLDHARNAVASAADTASEALEEAAGLAPINPGFWNAAGYYTTQFARGAVVDPLNGLADLGRGLLYDPASVVDGIWNGLTSNPGQFAKQMAGADMFDRSPMRWAGGLVGWSRHSWERRALAVSPGPLRPRKQSRPPGRLRLGLAAPLRLSPPRQPAARPRLVCWTTWPG